MRARAVTITLASLLACSTLALEAAAECESDAQCKGSRQCVEGACRTVDCATDMDCPGDRVCESSVCVAPARAAPPDVTIEAEPGPPGDVEPLPAEVDPVPVAEPEPPGEAPSPGDVVPPPEEPVIVATPAVEITRVPAVPPGYGTFSAEEGVVRKERRSTGAMVTGIVFLGVGGVGFAGGLVLTLSALEEESTCSSYDHEYDYYGCSSSYDELEDRQAMGAVMMGLGGALLITGAILTPIGARKVPVRAKDVGITELHIQPLLGPTGAGLHVAF